jgi:hypothetical protein
MFLINGVRLAVARTSFTLSRRTSTALASFLWLAGSGARGQATEQEYRSYKLDLQLNCLQETAAPGEPFFCDTAVVADPAGGGLMLPRVVPPFAIPNWPNVLIQFEMQASSAESTLLEVAPAARRGCYDMPGGPSPEELMILGPRELFGWRFDLNREDWLLPTEPGIYQIRAVLTLDARDKASGKLHEAWAKRLGAHPELEAKVVPRGKWFSNPVTVRVLGRAPAPADGSANEHRSPSEATAAPGGDCTVAWRIRAETTLPEEPTSKLDPAVPAELPKILAEPIPVSVREGRPDEEGRWLRRR